MTAEKWVPLKEEDGYEISDRGRIRGKRDWCLKYQPNQYGYLRVRLYNHETGAKPTYRVHRLVATNFIPNPDNLPEVHFKDGDKNNVNVSNLFWSTR